MYNELYEIWKRELESIELESLPPDFYSKVTDYVRKIREESRMLDKKTAKASLLVKEMLNVRNMIQDLTRTRYKKLVRKVAKGEKVSPDTLTIEEKKIYAGFSRFAQAYRRVTKNLLQGRSSKMDVGQEYKRVVVRCLREIPSIIGVDMKTYGPFKAEDVASLPAENAKILVRQDLAENVEVDYL